MVTTVTCRWCGRRSEWNAVKFEDRTLLQCPHCGAIANENRGRE